MYSVWEQAQQYIKTIIKMREVMGQSGQ